MKKEQLPPYMDVLFNKVYSHSALSGVLDDSRIVEIGNVWATETMMHDLLRDITRNSHVLQIGLTFGTQIERVYKKVAKRGKLDIFDVSKVQIARAKEKYAHFKINIMDYDATLPWDEKYDVVLCYNLLHEVPLRTRRKIMDNALNSLTNGGKAIFVDCAEPEPWNPIKWPLFLFNRLYRPFTESMWGEPIKNFCSLKDEFRWHHTYYRGGMFQKVVAVRKILNNEDLLKLTKLFRGT